ncbi:MAG: hypothetical protein RIA63_09200, partial [Cyclobacteriaceae bacterium]
MKRSVSILLIFVFLSLAEAHEFWLLPAKFKYKVGEKMMLDFKVGENFEGDYWNLDRHKVEKVFIHNRV